MGVAGLMQRLAMTKRCARWAVLVYVVGLALIGAPVRADILDETANFDIPAQPIRAALIEFSQQADVQVMGSSSTLLHLNSKPIKGRLRSVDALSLLLQDTGLKFETLRQAVVVTSIVDGDAMEYGDSVEGETSSLDSLRPPGTRPDGSGFLVPLGEMLVTGSNIRGGEPVGSHLIVMDRQAIDRTGYSTVQDVIRSLPQNFGGGPSEDTLSTADGNVSRATGLNLRGLGASSTLILINGRRLAPGGSRSSFVDVSSIPLAAVERIEVLLDSASAVYGSDAVGGVINFIMRNEFQGAETTGSAAAASGGVLADYNVSQLWGRGWSSGHVTVAYEYRQRGALAASDRDLAADSDLTRFGGSNFGSRMSSPGTLLIGGRAYAVPTNQHGIGLSPSSFIPNTSNLQNLNEGRDVTADVERQSAFLSMSQSLGESLSLFGDALYSSRHVEALNPGLSASFDVPATNPFLVIPAGANAAVPRTMFYNFVGDLGNRTLDAQVDTLSATFSTKVRLPRRWEMGGSFVYSIENVRQSQGNNISVVALRAALADPDPLTAFNPFGDAGSNSPATLDRIRRSTFYSAESKVQGVNISANGALFPLPAGDVRLAAGGDYRKETFQSRVHSPDAAISVTPQYERNVSAVFAELFVPVISGENRMKGVERLDLSLAGRYDFYDALGPTFNPRLGADWMPVAGISLHGSWGKSFRAPNLPDLDERNNLNSILELQDRESASGSSSALLMLGAGNADLRAESARSWNAGIKWEPDSPWSPVLDLSFFDIRFRDRIQSPAFTLTFLSDPRFISIVNRNPTLEQREQVCGKYLFDGGSANPSGTCASAPIAAIVDARINNTSTSTTKGLDLFGGLKIQNDWGVWEFATNVSYLLDYSEAQSRTAIPVSLLDTVGSPLRFRMLDSVSWTRGSLGISASVTYVGGYEDRNSIPNRDVASWTTVDLQLGYHVDVASTHWLAGCSLTLSVANLLDTDPPFVNNSTGVGYDRENADLTNRFVSLRLRKEW